MGTHHSIFTDIIWLAFFKFVLENMGLYFVIGNRDGEIIIDLKTIVDFRNSGFIDNIDDYSTALPLGQK